MLRAFIRIYFCYEEDSVPILEHANKLEDMVIHNEVGIEQEVIRAD